MKVLSFLAQKGGTGKTTLAAHIAVEAEARNYGVVACVDFDPQGSLTAWHGLRAANRPLLIDPRQELSDTGGSAHGRLKLMVIDTPPHRDAQSVLAAAAVADLVIIPVRPSLFDVDAVGATVEVVREVGRPGAFVLNAATPRGGRVDDAKRALEAYDLPICPMVIVNRVDFQDSVIDGLVAREFHPDGKAANEISHLWNWIRSRMR